MTVARYHRTGPPDGLTHRGLCYPSMSFDRFHPSRLFTIITTRLCHLICFSVFSCILCQIHLILHTATSWHWGFPSPLFHSLKCDDSLGEACRPRTTECHFSAVLITTDSTTLQPTRRYHSIMLIHDSLDTGAFQQLSSAIS